MEKTIYLDWNVFQDIFQKRRYLELRDSLEEWRDKKNYKIVFSSAHMRDLCKCQNKEYIKKDLCLLSGLTKNWCVGIRENEILSLEEIDTNIVFNEVKHIVQADKEELGNVNIGVRTNVQPFSVDVDKLSDDNIILPFLENDYLTSKSMENLINHLIEEDVFNDHVIQKKFRNSLKECVQINNPTFECVLEMPIYKFLLSDKEDIVSNLKDIINSFLSISGKSFINIPLGEQITTSYRILDFFPAFSEKLDRRNNQNNISIDSEHLFFASSSKYLICGDKKMIEKAKIIYKLCGVKTKILSPIEFVNILSL